MSFEAELRIMKETVAKLEEGSLTLQESITVFQEGLRAANACEEELKKEKGALTLLKNDYADISAEVEE